MVKNANYNFSCHFKFTSRNNVYFFRLKKKIASLSQNLNVNCIFFSCNAIISTFNSYNLDVLSFVSLYHAILSLHLVIQFVCFCRKVKNIYLTFYFLCNSRGCELWDSRNYLFIFYPMLPQGLLKKINLKFVKMYSTWVWSYMREDDVPNVKFCVNYPFKWNVLFYICDFRS